MTDTQPRYRAITLSNVSKVPQWEKLDSDLREAIETVARVLPFRTNAYLMDELIDWDSVPNDPIFQLTFPQREMLEDDQYARVRDAIEREAGKEEMNEIVNAIRMELNPHPAGQMTHNVPHINGEPIPGMQHKYRETALFFPSQGQTCHAYCTFCFRWAQFVGMDGLKFANKEADQLGQYVANHREITDVLFTGGDPMVMKAKVFERYVDQLLEIDHVRTIRIGSKSLAYWPQRYVTDGDADEMLRLFERIVDAGKQVAFMAHCSHPVEFDPEIARTAISRIRSTGANIRMQSPVIRHVNDDPMAWRDMWITGTRLGMIPYYMFVERDTGAKNYFEMPLERCWEIFRAAYQRVPGTARTVRGPSMSCHPGKVHILGVTEIAGEKAFMLEFLQARKPELVRQPFFAKYDPTATWFDQLEPLSENDVPFFQRDLDTVDLSVSV
jgi:KamA family protein